MATQAIESAAEAPPQRRWGKRLCRKIAMLVAAGVLLGLVYDWAAPRFYREGNQAGFKLGILHGALMPVALPSLLMGRDVPIYSASNSGRTYKIGYIFGINLCGLFFFGLAFKQPKQP